MDFVELKNTIVFSRVRFRHDGCCMLGMKKFLLLPLLVFSFIHTDANAMGKRREKVDGEKYKVYRISKGDHYSTGPHFKLPTNDDSFTFKVVFDDSAVYTSQTAENQYDVNKLIGFTDCGNMSIHKDSARIGWNWDHGQLHLYAYTYANKVRTFEKIGDGSLNEAMEIKVKIVRDHYVFTYNGKETKMARGCSKSKSFKTWSYPYFGGNETAPHEVKILLNW